MHICGIAIDGFRNFRQLQLTDLPASLAVVGENRAGKSNLLHALRLVLDPSLPDTARQLSADDFWDGFDAPFAGEEITVSVELVDFEGDRAAMALLGDYLVATSPKVARLTFAYRPRPGESDPANEGGYEPILYGGDRDDQRVGRDVLRYVSLRVLPALRDAEGDLGSARSPLRRLLARVDLDATQSAAAQEGIVDAGQALLSDDGIAAINTGISNRLTEMVGEAFAVETTLGIASTDVEHDRFERVAFVQVRGLVCERRLVGSHQVHTRGAVGPEIPSVRTHHGPRRSRRDRVQPTPGGGGACPGQAAPMPMRTRRSFPLARTINVTQAGSST